MQKQRIVVCCKCGSLYDIHYIDNVKYEKDHITHFECKHCGMVPWVGKNPEHFSLK